MTETPKLPSFLLTHQPWNEESNPIWPASVFTLHRNLGKYVFPAKMDAAQSQQVLQTLQGILLKNSSLFQGIFLKAESLSPLDKLFLSEHFLNPDHLQNTFSGQGFIIDPSGHFFAAINAQDHLQLSFTDTKHAWDKTWANLAQIEAQTGNAVDYAFNTRFGYLTADPAHCGTGLIAKAFLHVPALHHSDQLLNMLNKEKDEKVNASGLQGTLSDLVGDLLILSNQYTLGLSEDGLLQAVNSAAMKIMMAEKAARAQIQHIEDPHFKDLVSRAYGLLGHSYQLQTIEAMNALSLVKLGIDLGWAVGLNDIQANELFFNCQRAHLLHRLKQPSQDQEETARLRASFLHESLKPLQLKI